MEKLDIPKFETNKELYGFLVENKEALIAQKCSAIKFADGFESGLVVVNNSFSNKSAEGGAATEVLIKAVINTTGIMDSHSDVHVKGLWNKSLKENKRLMHLQEHKSNEFNKIIASGNDLKAYVKDYTWKELGYNAEGSTEALVFESTVKEARNPYMFNQYKNGYVDNHSVGMQYVKLNLAVNDPDYEKEKSLFDQHIENIANKDAAEKQGYFWVVTEAKAIEGSAVPNGSNPITPTISIGKSEVGGGNEETVDTAKMKAIKAFLGVK